MYNIFKKLCKNPEKKSMPMKRIINYISFRSIPIKNGAAQFHLSNPKKQPYCKKLVYPKNCIADWINPLLWERVDWAADKRI